MSKFPVVQYMIHKKDGSNELQQVMPQTDISAVRGLAPKVKKYEQFLQLLTKKNVEYIITKQDLANYVTKDELNKKLQDSKKYTDKAIQNIMSKVGTNTLTNGTNVDLLTTTGIYYKPKDVSVTGLPPYNTINQSGLLIVMHGSDDRLFQKWISMDITVYEYERIPQYPLSSPVKWNGWTYK